VWYILTENTLKVDFKQTALTLTLNLKEIKQIPFFIPTLKPPYQNLKTGEFAPSIRHLFIRPIFAAISAVISEIFGICVKYPKNFG